jgi:hypothetical protein
MSLRTENRLSRFRIATAVGAGAAGVAPAAGRLGPIASAPIPVTAVRKTSLRAFFWAQGRRSGNFFVKTGNLFMGVLQIRTISPPDLSNRPHRMQPVPRASSLQDALWYQMFSHFAVWWTYKGQHQGGGAGPAPCLTALLLAAPSYAYNPRIRCIAATREMASM